MQPLIRYTNVSKSFDSKAVLNNISFDVYKGEIIGLIGSSGAGKTTFLRTVIGFYKITTGSIIYKGREISKDMSLMRNLVGFASQEPCFYEELTVEENLMYFGKLHKMSKKEIKENIDRVLKLVDLLESKKALGRNLSGGMKKRLDVACALIHNPEILIMDEPGTGLDPLLRKHMWELVQNINRQGTTVIVSSHQIGDIEHICHRVGIISRGRLLVSGTPNQLKYVYSKNEEVQLETYPGRYDKILLGLKQKKAPVTFHVNKEHKLILYTPRAEVLLHQILHVLEELNERLLDVDVNKPSLSEVFQSFTALSK